MKKLSVKQQYEIYKREYFKKQNKIAEQGGEMFSPMYSIKRFRERYLETKAMLYEETKEGKRKGPGNVYQYMISDQAYALEYKQYKALRHAYKEAGEEVNFTRFDTMSEIRYKASDKFWDFIEVQYKDLIANGSTGSAAHDWIAKEFFGSN